MFTFFEGRGNPYDFLLIKGRKARDSSYEVKNDQDRRRRKDHYRENPERTELETFDSRLDFFDCVFESPYINKKDTGHKCTNGKG